MKKWCYTQNGYVAMLGEKHVYVYIDIWDTFYRGHVGQIFDATIFESIYELKRICEEERLQYDKIVKIQNTIKELETLSCD